MKKKFHGTNASTTLAVVGVFLIISLLVVMTFTACNSPVVSWRAKDIKTHKSMIVRLQAGYEAGDTTDIRNATVVLVSRVSPKGRR